jgi:homoserine kinase type II
MAVFTPVSEASLQNLLSRFDLGRLTGFEGIASGIENTNYFVDTTQGRFVLTLFEKLTAAELPFYLELMLHLASRGIACPKPMADRDGRIGLDGDGAVIVKDQGGHILAGLNTFDNNDSYAVFFFVQYAMDH